MISKSVLKDDIDLNDDAMDIGGFGGTGKKLKN